ncbi:hypothetical protein AB0L71_08000 [Streptomyces sp. NPDC052052]|uniref:hypothetical protein n=1 Tax=Streptomyces sp. NPDC052052 TaxID=3154756 RepID=UPI00341361D5
MADRRAFLAATVGAGLTLVGGVGQQASAATGTGPAAGTSDEGHIRSVSALTRVYGDGQKFVGVAVEYDREILGAGLSPSTFTVDGRTVTAVYAATTPELRDEGRARDGSGRFVVVELSPEDDGAALWGTRSAGGTPVILTPSATLTGTGPVRAVDGHRFPADSTPRTTQKVHNAVVDDFRQLTFHDPETGRSLEYNLFVPRDYDPRKHYPLVLFMHDASVVGAPVLGPLVQGVGAIVWAGEEEQAKHECLVVAPQYPSVVVEDDYLPTDLFDTTIHLVEHLTETYAVDRRRRYTTGQSMGAMMSLGFGIRYTDVFAALYVVAGQWPAEQAAPLAGKKMWVHVSQGDTKAFPGENAIMEVIEAQGVRVATAPGWDARSTQAEFAAEVRAVLAQKAPVQYTTFLTGTVAGADGNPGSEHMGTWRYAYDIPGIRDWLFRQSL